MRRFYSRFFFSPSIKRVPTTAPPHLVPPHKSWVQPGGPGVAFCFGFVRLCFFSWAGSPRWMYVVPGRKGRQSVDCENRCLIFCSCQFDFPLAVRGQDVPPGRYDARGPFPLLGPPVVTSFFLPWRSPSAPIPPPLGGSFATVPLPSPSALVRLLLVVFFHPRLTSAFNRFSR